jgi:hypothetical protein
MRSLCLLHSEVLSPNACSSDEPGQENTGIDQRDALFAFVVAVIIVIIVIVVVTRFRRRHAIKIE